jgi:hypothetical protein
MITRLTFRQQLDAPSITASVGPYAVITRVLSCALAGFCAVPLAYSQSTALSLPGPTTSVTLPGGVSPNRSVPKLSSGTLISFERWLSSATNIMLDDIHTGLTRTSAFWLPQAKHVLLYDAALTADKRSLVLAGTYSPSGGGTDVDFLGVSDQASGKVFVISLGDYVPERVCIASDGSIWTLGQTTPEVEHVETSPQPAYDMVRSYRLDGTLLGSFLTRSSQGSRALDLRPSGHAFGNQVHQAKLSCGDQSVGVFIGQPVFSWSEINLSTKTIQQWTIDPTGSVMTGLALLGPNTVYASFGGKSAGLFKLELHSGLIRGKWNPVGDHGPASNPFASLLGRDGPALVHYRGTQRPTNALTLYWSTP